MWKKIKDVFGIVDTIHKAIDGLIWAAGFLVPTFVVSSSTLRFWLFAGGTLGLAGGYFVTTALFRGKGSKTCKISSAIHAVLAVIAFIAFTFLLVVLKPDFASLSPSFITIREVLLKSDVAPNLGAFILCGLTIWFAVGAVTLLSSRLWTAPSPTT